MDMSSTVVWPSIGGVRMASHFLGTGTGRGDGAVSCVVPVQSRLASSNLRYRHNFWAPSIAVAALPRRLESAQLPRATSGPTPGSRPAADAVPPPAVLRPAVPGYRKHPGGVRGGAPPDRHTLDLSSLPGGSPPAPGPPWRRAEGVRGAAPRMIYAAGYLAGEDSRRRISRQLNKGESSTRGNSRGSRRRHARIRRSR